MTRDRDLVRLLDAWLSDGPLVVADRVIDDVADRIARQPQRPAWRLQPWRFSTMTQPFKLAASAALTVAAVIGVAALAVPHGGGGPGAGPSSAPPSATPSPSASAAPSMPPSDQPAVPSLPASGAIVPGTYHVAAGPWTAVGYQLTVPAGWIAQNGGQTLSKHPDQAQELTLNPFVVDGVYADPCGNNKEKTVGPSADDLASALMAQPGPVKSGPSTLMLGGRPAKLVQLTYPAGLDPTTCDPPIGLQIWHTVTADAYLVVGPDSTANVFIADADGGRLVIVAASKSGSTTSDVSELDGIIGSVRFDAGG